MYTNRRNFRVSEEIGVGNTMATSDLRAEVEIWPFRACAMKTMQYNRYYRNSSLLSMRRNEKPAEETYIQNMKCKHTVIGLADSRSVN